MSFLRTTAILFQAQLRRIWISKRALFCLFLALGPVVVATMVRLISHEEGEGPPEMFLLVIEYIVLIQTTIPVIAHDAHLRWPARSTTLRPGHIHITVLDPIDTSSWSETTTKQHAAEVNALFESVLEPHQRPANAA